MLSWFQTSGTYFTFDKKSKSGDIFAVLVGLLLSAAFFATPFYDTMAKQGSFAPDYYKAILVQSAIPLLFALWLWLGNRTTIFIDSISFFGLLVVAEMILSLTWAFHVDLGMISTSRFIAGALMLLFCTQIIQSKRGIHLILAIVLVSAFLLSVLGYLQALATPWGKATPVTHFFAALVKQIPQAVPPAATFSNRNMAMDTFILLFPLPLYFLVVTRGYWAIFPGIAMGTMYGYLLASENRATMIGFLLELLLALILVGSHYYRKQKNRSPEEQKGLRERVRGYFVTTPPIRLKPFFVAPKLLAVLVALSVFLFMANVRTGTGDYTPAKSIGALTENLVQVKENSLHHRIILWKTTLKHMVPDHLIEGVGAGNWTVYFSAYNAAHDLIVTMDASNPNSKILYKQSHNEYVQFLAEQGLLGLIPGLLLVFALFYFCWRLFKYSLNSEYSLLWQSLMVGTIGFSINLGASFPFRTSTAILVLALYLAIMQFVIHSTMELDEEKDAKPESLPKKKNKGNKKDKDTKSPVLVATEGVVSESKNETWLHKVLAGSIGIPNNLPVKIIFSLLLLGISFSAFMLFHQRWIPGQAYRNFAVAWLQAGNRDMGIEYLRRSLRIDPDDPDDALYTLGNLYASQGDYSKAVDTYKHLISCVLPWHPYAHIHLAETYVKAQRYPDAILSLKRSIHHMPKQSAFYALLGSVYARADNSKALGAAYIRKALSLPNQFPKAQLERLQSFSNGYPEDKVREAQMIQRDLDPRYAPDAWQEAGSSTHVTRSKDCGEWQP